MRRRTVHAAGILLAGLLLAPFETGPAPLVAFGLGFAYVVKTADADRLRRQSAGVRDYLLVGLAAVGVLALGIAIG